mmetsp:Transcript_15033/g.22155  ORF Transcript_15033/g.22155 Transcript_15033/m.22155 type:complete len:150 (-) Transcript_15033:60-509(-)|eukprot:CAMPEP_0195509720 /NCGR_PEP_ID=MMETSP0794_2-20130614/2576_1 /TAXON_ID=515487 /ORGANISM="Stephanopyxis turris, Strain CCMP 815" /LENGTH=149 /DNA_ID=CAMNT_0040637003 /DNA_START=252 /DNA_END=701 /DNA_ORIENTATION=+
MDSNDGDFVDYFDSMVKRQAEEEELNFQMEQHEIWKTTTLTGRLVSLVQNFGKSPFITALVDSFRNQEGGTSWNMILLRNVARLMILAFGIVTILSLSKIWQAVVGKEIVYEQEIVIVEEVPRSKALEDEKKKKDSKPRRSARDKKHRD